MAEQDLIEQIGYCCKLFMRIVIFALFGVILCFASDIDPVRGYKVIIGFALLGAAVSVFDVLKRL
jgi:hypothetical protein